MILCDKLGACFNRFHNDGTTPLPKRVLGITFAFMFFNGMTMTMVFSYLPKLVKWFGTSEVDTGYYAGLIASAMYVGRTIFCFIWGYVADTKGKKFAAITCATCLTITSLAFGLSTNFYVALVTRFFQGCSMGLIVVCKSILIDKCDDTNVTLGMAILLSSFSVGLLVGPSLAGFLVFPAERFPTVVSQESLLGRFPILLPNLIIVIGLVIFIVIGIFYLPKDGDSRPVFGENAYLINRESPNTCYSNNFQDSNSTVSFKRKNPDTYFNLSIEESADWNKQSIHYFQIVEASLELSTSISQQHQGRKVSFVQRLKNSKAAQVFRNKWCVVCSVLYGVFSLEAIGFDEMFPLFTATDRLYGGVDFDPADIGLVLLIVASVLIVVQITLLAKLTVKYGSKKMFISSVLILGFILPLLPSISQIPDTSWLWAGLSVYLLICRVALAESFLAVNILLNNSVDSSLLGSANGLGLSLSSLGRAIAPAVFGSVYSWSLTNIKGIEGNEKALGFPLNQYLTFFVLSFLSLVNTAIASRIPDHLNKEMQQSDDVIENKSSNRVTSQANTRTTNISVSFFTPSSE